MSIVAVVITPIGAVASAPAATIARDVDRAILDDANEVRRVLEARRSRRDGRASAAIDVFVGERTIRIRPSVAIDDLSATLRAFRAWPRS